ncbi:phosphoglycolate phosphatase [Sphingomonas sp. UYAg733]
MNRLALFDCDGTLVDSQANICQAMEEAFMLHRLDPPGRDDIRRVVGLSLVEVMRSLLPHAEDAQHRALAEDYRHVFLRLRTAGALTDEPLFDGMIEALDMLTESGWVFGVATGKSDRGLIRVLDEHGIRPRFVTLQTADRHPSKPHPSMIETAIREAGASPETTVMIGDTSYDMLMARAGNVRALGVAWGYHPTDELIAAGAHAIAEAVADLPGHMETIKA